MRLHFLDVSYNGFGPEAADILGRSLVDNSVLRVLDLTSTRLNDHAIVKLAKGLETNEGLEKLVVMVLESIFCLKRKIKYCKYVNSHVEN